MAIAIVQLPPDSTGKMIAARSYTESSNTVYAQAGYLTTDTASGNPAVVTNAAPSTAGSDYALVTRSMIYAGVIAAQSPAGLTTATSATATGLLNAGNVTVTVKGTYGFTTTPPTYIFEASDDSGTNWYAITAIREDTGMQEQTGVLPANGLRTWNISIAGYDQVRFRLTAWGTPSGTISVKYTPGGMLFEPPSTHVPNSRVNCTFGALAATGATSETLLTLTPNRDHVAGSTGTSIAVTTGKRLRITSFGGVWRNASATAGSNLYILRINPTGTVTTSSPPVAAIGTGVTAATTGQVSPAGPLDFIDGGIEVIYPGQIGITQTALAATASGAYAWITGYEY